MVTSVICALFVGSAIWLGCQAWQIGQPRLCDREERGGTRLSFTSSPSAEYVHLAERLCVMVGFVGAAIGLSLQAKSLAGSATSFTALATSLCTTASGGTAAAFIAIMTFNLEAGDKRTQRSLSAL